MATFSSWSAEYTRFKNALATMTVSQLVQSGYTDGRGMTVTFKKYSDLINYEKFLKAKADEEANTGGRRKTMFVMGYGGTG